MKKWEKEYDDFKNGKMDMKIKNLEDKVNSNPRTADAKEYEEFKKLDKVRKNIDKVTNIIELRDKIQMDLDSIKDEQARRKTLNNANKEKEQIEEKLNEIIKKRDILQKKLKSETEKRKTKKVDNDKETPEEMEAKKQLNQINVEFDKNNQQYISNQNVFLNNEKNKSPKLTKISDENLEKKAFELSTKKSKCNFVANNLMKGLTWDSIEIQLDTKWKDRKFKSKDKLSEKIIKNDEKEVNADESKATSKEEEKKTDDSIENLEDKIIKETEKNIKDSEKPEEKALAIKSDFAEKHPRLAKIGQWFKEKFAKEPEIEKNIPEDKKEDKNAEDIEENRGSDNEFKEYLKEVAEKGMEELKKEKLDEAKRRAHERETEKFGKDYADNSYNEDER